MKVPDSDLICALCGCDVRKDAQGLYRHAHDPWEDCSAFCERYGYPVPVEPRIGAKHVAPTEPN